MDSDKDKKQELVDGIINFDSDLPITVKNFLEDIYHTVWDMSFKNKKIFKNLYYVFNWPTHIIHYQNRKMFGELISKTKSKIDSEKTKKRFANKIITCKFDDKSNIFIHFKVVFGKKEIKFNTVTYTELYSPSKHRNEYGNIYLFRLDGPKFSSSDEYSKYTIIAITWHALDRFAERIGITERLTRFETIRVFIDSLLSNPIKFVMEKIKNPDEETRNGIIFIDTNEEIMYLPGESCKLLMQNEKYNNKGTFIFCKTSLRNDNFSSKSIWQIRNYHLTKESWNIENDNEVIFNSEY